MKKMLWSASRNKQVSVFELFSLLNLLLFCFFFYTRKAHKVPHILDLSETAGSTRGEWIMDNG